jgi:DNA replication protein DnaC
MALGQQQPVIPGVFHQPAAALVNELLEAKHQLQLRRVLARWSRYDLIAIDEVGYVPLAEVGAEFLFQVIAERAEKAAVIMTTNLLCGAPHNRFNADCNVMRSPIFRDPACWSFWSCSTRHKGARGQ